MRMFRKPLTLTNCEFTSQVKKSETGIDGVLFNINGEVVIKYDISQNYEIQKGILGIKLEEKYNLKKYSFHQVGIDNVSESFVSTKILEKVVSSDVVIDGWNKYVDIIPLDKIVKFLIARDIFLLKLSRPKYAGSTPSWDVCISLAMYLRLCEKIENFEEKLHMATDIGDHIRGNLRKLDVDIQKGDYFSKHLVPLLQSLHKLTDELELAYHLSEQGYNIRFGSRGEPDYFIGDIPIEQKSRFPKLEDFFKQKLPRDLPYIEALKDLIFKTKQHRKGLSRSEIFFCNVSRLVEAFNFYASTELTKSSFNATSFNLADVYGNFGIVMRNVSILLERGKAIVPYVKLYSIDPKIIGFPISEDAFNAIKGGEEESP